MDITVKNSDLLTALNLVRPAIDGKAGFESSHVYMKVITTDNKGWLYLYCSNFFSQVITKIEVKVKEEGEVLIPPQKLVDSLRTANKETQINISTPDAARIRVKTVGKGFSFHLSCHSGVANTAARVKALFPLKAKVAANIELPILMEFFKRTQFCVLPTVTSNSHLDAIRLSFTKGYCEATATDRIVAVRSKRVIESTNDSLVILISRDEYALLSKVFSDQKDTTVSITPDLDKGTIFFSSNSTVYGARILAGGFPDIPALFKKAPDYNFHVPTKELLAIAQRARIFANDKSIVRIVSTSEQVELTVAAGKGKDNSDFTEAVAILPGSSTIAEGKDIYVDIDYVINILSTSSSSEVILGMSETKGTPIVFHEPASEETKNTEVDYIMMGRTQW